MPTHPIYGNYLATYTPMVGVSIGAPITIGGFDPLTIDPVFYVDASTSMLGVLEAPPLDLNPAVPSSLDIITATRVGTATYTDASGNIQTAAENTVRVDHVQGEELTPTKFQRVGYTDFSSGWLNNGSSDVAGSGYNGEPSVVITGSQNNASLFFNCPAVVGQEYIISMYIRRVSGTGTIRMRHVNADGDFETDITITNDWSKVEVPFTANSTSIPVGPQMALNGESIEIAMPQVEEGTTASDFVVNTTGSPKFFAAATYAPRVPMMLIEPAATNLVTNTDFSVWVQASSTTLTDGSGYAGQPSKIFEATSGTHRTFRSPVFTTTAGTTYTGSIWIRRVSGTGDIQINHQSSAQGNLTKITNSISEEWTRVEVDFTGHASGGDVWFGVWVNVQGDSVEIAMPQVEEGTVATSFIPTSGSAVTRAADNLVIDGSDFTNFYNTDEGTFYVEFNPTDFTIGEQYLLRGGDNNRRFLYSNGNLSNIRSYDGANILPIANTVESNTLNRVAVSFDSTTMKGSSNGATVATATHNGNLLTSPLLQIGTNYIGHIKRVIYWPLHSDSL